MGDAQKWPLSEARKVAVEIEAALAPLCKGIRIAGSIRRQKPMVGDIEILYIPRLEPRPVDMFLSEDASLPDLHIHKWEQDGVFTRRLSKAGVTTWGSKNKLALHVPSGIPVDFFATTEDNWWVSLVIRTGSKDTNLRLTDGAIKRGRHLNAYGCGVTMPDGQTVKANSEEEVFELCGVPYLQPEDR